MKTCFGYVRVSTAKQGEGVSLEAQQEAISAFASRHNIMISKWFEEKETAAKKGRPIFNRMVADLRRRNADGVIIHKIDRSARNFADWAKIGDLADAGVDIHFATESLDFRSRGGRLTADIQAVIAADYIRNLREETIKGINGRLKQGLYPFKAPIGYLDNGGGKPKTIDPLTAPMVRQVFERYASGNYSLHSLTDVMERDGYRKRCGRPLSKSNIEWILKNPFYVGIIHIKRTGKTYEGIHEPLIPISMFDRVKAMRDGRDNKKTTKHRLLFRGLFMCGNCQKAMIGERQKGHVYYRCHTASCATKSFREEVIHEQIEEALRRFALTGAQLKKLRAWFIRHMEETDGGKAQQQAAAFELSKIDERLSRLADKLIDGVVDDELYETKKAALLLERKRWQELVDKEGGAQAKIGKLDRFLELAKNLCLHYQLAAEDQKRELVIFAFSNRLAVGKSLLLEPSNWVLTLQNALPALVGAPHRDSSRTFERIEKLLKEIQWTD